MGWAIDFGFNSPEVDQAWFNQMKAFVGQKPTVAND
jgi:hypothetical protein